METIKDGDDEEDSNEDGEVDVGVQHHVVGGHRTQHHRQPPPEFC